MRQTTYIYYGLSYFEVEVSAVDRALLMEPESMKYSPGSIGQNSFKMLGLEKTSEELADSIVTKFHTFWSDLYFYFMFPK